MAVEIFNLTRATYGDFVERERERGRVRGREGEREWERERERERERDRKDSKCLDFFSLLRDV